MSKETKVGLFVTLSLIAVATLIVMVGGTGIFKKGYKVNVLFDDVGGLKIKAPVRLAGMEVGMVKHMEIVDDKVKVVLWIREDVRIRSDATITINTLGMIGEKYIDISMGSQSAPFLLPNATVKGVEPVAVMELFERGERIAQTLDRTLVSIENLLKEKEPRRRLKRIGENIEEISKRALDFIEKDLPNFTSTLKDVQKSAKDFSSTCIKLEEHINTLSNELRAFMKNAQKNVQESTTQMQKNVEEASSNFSNFIKELDTLSKDISPKLKDTIHDLNILAKDAREAGENLKEFSQFLMDKEVALMLKNTVTELNLLIEDIRKHPWKLLRRESK